MGSTVDDESARGSNDNQLMTANLPDMADNEPPCTVMWVGVTISDMAGAVIVIILAKRNTYVWYGS